MEGGHLDRLHLLSRWRLPDAGTDTRELVAELVPCTALVPPAATPALAARALMNDHALPATVGVEPQVERVRAVRESDDTDRASR